MEGQSSDIFSHLFGLFGLVILLLILGHFFTGSFLHCGPVLGSLGPEEKILRVDGVARGSDQVKFYHSRHSAIHMTCTVLQPNGEDRHDQEREGNWSLIGLINEEVDEYSFKIWQFQVDGLSLDRSYLVTVI